MEKDLEETGMGEDVNDPIKNVAKGMRNRANSKSSGSAAGDIGGAMMMTGDPTTMAAGATLKVVSGIADRKRKERQDKADAENNRRSKLMSALAGLGSGVGQLGM